MADSIHTPSKGYPPAIVTCWDRIHFEAKCGHCLLLLKNPVQTSCGHHFCKSCIVVMFEKGGKADSIFIFCPPCKTDGMETPIYKDQIYEDRNISKLLNNLSVKCIENPCQWKGNLEHYEKHPCPQIKEEQPQIKSISNVQSDARAKDADMMEGIEHGLVASSTPNPFASINLIISEVKNLRNAAAHNKKKIEIVDKKTEIFEGMTSLVSTSAEKMLKQCDEVKTFCAHQERETRDLKATVETLKNELLLLKRELQQRPEDCSISKDGTLTWRLTEVRQKRQLAVAETVTYWVSEPFQTSQYGYKMQLKIYLNGDGSGKNKYVSLFFIILKSAFDNILSWPFQQKVKFTALDQSGRGQHVVDAFRPDLSSSSFQQPVAAANIATGCPLFMPISLLEGNGSRDSGLYVKDDAMFIRATVDRSGLHH